jgi:hypothetical protein
MAGILVTALRGFARHQAESQPDDAPNEPGGVLSIPDPPSVYSKTSERRLTRRRTPADRRAPLLVKRQRVVK